MRSSSDILDDVVFETERLYVRLWNADDAEACLAIYGDIEVMRYLGSAPVPVASIEEMAEKLAKRIELQAAWEPGKGLWAVARKEDDQLVGGIIFKDLPNSSGVEPTHEVEVGWHFAKAHWGKGYATEAAKGALLHGLRLNPGIQEVIAICYDANEPSKRVMDRLGMTSVGMTSRFYDIECCCYTISRENALALSHFELEL
jgi:[ribosomal protein S5]-alanine N-acetyltransferase